MASKFDKLRALYAYKQATGVKEVDPHELAKWAHRHLQWPMPEPQSPLDRLAKEFSRAMREETRKDAKTGKPYRAHHAYPSTEPNGQTVMKWVDIDEAPRKQMHKSLQLRREQMVGDGLQLSLDADHWNSVNPKAEPIEIELDFTDDIEWRKNAPDDEDEKDAG